MTSAQPEFAAALLDPARPVPPGLIRPDGRGAGKRFDVYRNNVAASLIAALETAFPALHALVGQDRFRALAIAHYRVHPPASPLLMFYGEAMPDFLGGYGPLRQFGYLPDLARLELARRKSYHAADATPVEADSLTSLGAEDLMASRLRLAPALRLVRSRWPVHAIWQAAQEPSAKAPEPGGQNVLIARPGYDPTMSVLPPGGGSFLDALLRGRRLEHALAAAEAALPGFDPAETFALLVAAGGIIGLERSQ